MQSLILEQESLLEKETASCGQSEMRKAAIGAWNVVRIKKKYIPAAHCIDGSIEYANVEYDTAQEAQEFCDAACEMLERKNK